MQFVSLTIWANKLTHMINIRIVAQSTEDYQILWTRTDFIFFQTAVAFMVSEEKSHFPLVDHYVAGLCEPSL